MTNKVTKLTEMIRKVLIKSKAQPNINNCEHGAYWLEKTRLACFDTTPTRTLSNKNHMRCSRGTSRTMPGATTVFSDEVE